MSKFTGNADGLSESVQDNTGGLHLAQNVGSWKQFFEKWKEPCVDGFRVPWGPTCVRHDWDGCRCCLVDMEKKRERKVWRAHGTPLLCIKPIVTLLWCPHGTELVMAGRIRMAEGMDVDVAAGVEFPRTYGMVLRRCESLSWNVAGDVFLSQTSMLKTGVLKLGMTDFSRSQNKNDGRHERTNGRGGLAHDGDKHVDERKLLETKSSV